MSSNSNHEAIEQVLGFLKQSQHILFITGAGISADSGLPTYRGIGGLYNVDTTEDGLPIEQALSGDIINERPELTWKYLAQIEETCRDAKPNRAHEIIAEMETHFPRVWTLTQNIDGLHHRAGAENVIDIHGDLHHLRCTRCAHRRTVEDYSSLSLPPRCPECDAIVRPDVVLFGEMLPQGKTRILYEELYEGFDMVFSIGTTSVFPYIAEPVRVATQMGWRTVEINPGTSNVSHMVDAKLSMRAAPAMEAIWQRYREMST